MARLTTSCRKCSRARLISCSISAFAPVTIRSASVLASSLASSTISLARFCACATISEAWPFASLICSAARFSASSCSCWPRSAASRPSAIYIRRASSAPMTGGQINFIQNQTNNAKVIDWPIKVRLMFINELRFLSYLQL